MPPTEPEEPVLSPAPAAAILASDTPGVTLISAPTTLPLEISGRPGGSLWFPVGLALALALPQGGSRDRDSIGSEFGPGLSPPVPGDTTGAPDFSSPPGAPGSPGSPGLPGTPGLPTGVTPEPVPEPSTTVTMACLLLVSGAGILRNRRRREGKNGHSGE
jgi:hypothetical protein